MDFRVLGKLLPSKETSVLAKLYQGKIGFLSLPCNTHHNSREFFQKGDVQLSPRSKQLQIPREQWIMQQTSIISNPVDNVVAPLPPRGDNSEINIGLHGVALDLGCSSTPKSTCRKYFMH
jgi:hypothetical protein